MLTPKQAREKTVAKQTKNLSLQIISEINKAIDNWTGANVVIDLSGWVPLLAPNQSIAERESVIREYISPTIYTEHGWSLELLPRYRVSLRPLEDFVEP